ncbi:hypothetical protein Hamer_G001438 [Homarus americanus]|uniref:Uncharacterized protein n=1 Tax=Homarus americanus TaxID=6706 RepID=A0A8J5TMR3_HOMAM|nr:hypothetical protein Hamer_G001438 [Homarus americanus]
MGLRRVSPVMRVGGWGWFRLDARHAALSAAIYTMFLHPPPTPLFLFLLLLMLLLPPPPLLLHPPSHPLHRFLLLTFLFLALLLLPSPPLLHPPSHLHRFLFLTFLFLALLLLTTPPPLLLHPPSHPLHRFLLLLTTTPPLLLHPPSHPLHRFLLLTFLFLALLLLTTPPPHKERCGMVTPWVVANITFMALEAVCCMYSNVLRDHINKKFDTMCKAEMTFFVTRLFLNILALWGVMRFYRNIRSGLTYKDPEAIEL